MPGTLNKHFLLDVCWNNHFVCKDLVHHPTETTVKKWLFRVPGVYKYSIHGACVVEDLETLDCQQQIFVVKNPANWRVWMEGIFTAIVCLVLVQGTFQFGEVWLDSPTFMWIARRWWTDFGSILISKLGEKTTRSEKPWFILAPLNIRTFGWE